MLTSSKDITLSTNLETPCCNSKAWKLWDELRKTSLDAIQASTPNFTSFGEECLHLAYIYLKNPPIDEEATRSEDILVESSNSAAPGYISADRRDLSHSAWPLENEMPTTLSTPQILIGLVYMKAGLSNVPAGEVNIGVVIDPEYRRCGYAGQAVVLMLNWAFEELRFHRVQAAIVDTEDKEAVHMLFTSLGFQHEGIRRRSVYLLPDEERAEGWCDVIYLAMLDTEWILRSYIRDTPRTVWDELLARHSREREELVKWDEKRRRLRKTASTETIKRKEDAGKQREHVYDISPFADRPDFAIDTALSSSSCQSSNYGSLPPSPRSSSSYDIVTDAEEEELRKYQRLAPPSDRVSQQELEWASSSSSSRSSSPQSSRSLLSPLLLPTVPSSSYAPSPIPVPPSSPSPSLSSASEGPWGDEGASSAIPACNIGLPLTTHSKGSPYHSELSHRRLSQGKDILRRPLPVPPLLPSAARVENRDQDDVFGHEWDMMDDTSSPSSADSPTSDYEDSTEGFWHAL